MSGRVGESEVSQNILYTFIKYIHVIQYHVSQDPQLKYVCAHQVHVAGPSTYIHTYTYMYVHIHDTY